MIDAVEQLMWTSDGGGKVVYLNRRWEEFVGPRQEALGKGWVGLYTRMTSPSSRAFEHLPSPREGRTRWSTASARAPATDGSSPGSCRFAEPSDGARRGSAPRPTGTTA